MTDQGVDQRSKFTRARWRMLLAVMFCYLFYYTGRQTFGFAIPGIEKELGIDKATLGWISAVMLWCYALGQAINGNLGDKFGGRRMMSLGAILSCGFNWLTSMGTGFMSLALPWGVNGYVQAMGWAPGSRLLSNWWGTKQHGTVYGLYVFAAGLSSVLSFVTSLLIVDTLKLDWRWIFRLPVLLLGLAGVLFYLVVRERPEDMGFAPIDAETGEAGAEGPGAAAMEEAGVQETSRERYLGVITNMPFMLGCVAIGFQSLARYGLIIWVPVYFLGKDWAAGAGGVNAKWITLALPIGMAAGALVSGWVSDRLPGARRSIVIALALTLAGLTSFTMWFLHGQQVAGICVLFLCGFFTYGPQSLFWALCPGLLGRHRTGTGTGVMDTFAYVFAGLGSPFIGSMMQRYDSPGVVFVVVGAAAFTAAALSLFIRR